MSRISHSGLVGGTTSLPDITFTGLQLQNRVDTLQDQLFPMNWWRIARIDTEYGGTLIVNYAPQECVPGTSAMPNPSAPHANTLRCFPVRWTPDGHENPITDHFHKYVVAEIREGDLTGGAPDVVHRYTYLGDAAWHYTDDDGLVKAEDKTWSQWRGYATVQERTGDPADTTQTLTQAHYFRGMHGDHLPTGSRSVTLPALDMDDNGNTGDANIDVPAAADHDAFAGMLRQSITFNGVGGAEVSSAAYLPWQSDPTATRTINGSTVTARFINTAGVYTRTALDSDHGTRQPGWRTTTATTTFDAFGMPVRVDDRGDNNVADDQKCFLTDYARTTDPSNSKWITALVQRSRTFGVDCATAESGSITVDDIIGDQRNLYDGQPYGAAPVRGSLTEQQIIKEYAGGTPAYITVTKAQYDGNGRVTDRWDVDNRHSGISYQPAEGPVTQIVTTNPKGWTSTSFLEPAWGILMGSVDFNGKRTDLTRDGLGRTTGVWLPGQSKSAGHAASFTYSYTVRTDGTNAIAANKLNPAGNGYITSIDLYDGLLRSRQTQSADAAVTGARVVVDTLYDSAGRARKSTIPYPMTGTPSVDLYQPRPPDYSGPEALPGWTTTIYDGTGRVSDSILYSRNVEQWRTHTSYGGDRADVTPPTGATATSTVTDAAGRTTAVRQYHGPAPNGNHDTISYRYNRKGQLDRIADAAGNRWEYTYDLRGRQATIKEPDRGETTLTYYDNGKIETATDARGITLAYTYDELDRKTSLRAGSTTGTIRAEWTYDTVAKGHLSRSTRYVQNGSVTDAYSFEVLSYSDRYGPGIVRYTLPTSETGFGATTFTYTYFRNKDGSLSGIRIPGAGGLALETINYGYNSLALPRTLSGGAGTMVTDTSYTNYGDPSIITLRNATGPITQIGHYYTDDGARRLAEIKTTSAAVPTTFTDSVYTHDPAGNITEIADSVSGDNQCFRYDHLRRLTDAWTPANGDCTAVPTVQALGGPATYWQSFTYDSVGNRTSHTDHVANINSDYTYPDPQTGQPHALSKVDYSGSVSGTANYAYDQVGNTLCRPSGSATNECTTGSGSQGLAWDAEGHLTEASDAAGTSRFIYDADGNRLIRKDPTGKTLYLPMQEIRWTAGSGVTTCTRFYPFAGKTIATRTSTAASLTWLAGNEQNTATTAIRANTPTASTRWLTPFGSPRGTATGTWPTGVDKGFVGGTNDNTGTVHLGKRQYDPTIGRFTSRDPLMDINDPQQWHGYGYASGSPVTYSDPAGLMPLEGSGGGPVKVRGTASAHATAIALRVTRLKVKYPHATITSDPTDEHGPDIVCWNCVPDIVWVWEVKPDWQGEARGLRDGLDSLKTHLEQARLDPLAQGRPAVPGPMFESPDVGRNPIRPSQQVTVRSRAPGVELYRVDEHDEQRATLRWKKKTDEAFVMAERLNKEAGEKRAEIVRTGQVVPPYQPPAAPHMDPGVVTSGPEDVIVYTGALFFILWGGVAIAGAGSAGATAAAAGVTAACVRGQFVLCA